VESINELPGAAEDLAALDFEGWLIGVETRSKGARASIC
jgi:hypothetical protein